MNRTDIKTLATSLTIISPDDSTISRFIDDIFNENGLSPNAQLIASSIKPVVSGTMTYSFESSILVLLYVFFNNEMLSLTTISDLDAYTTTWFGDSGLPKAFTQDELSARNYTIYPKPNVNGDPTIPIHGQPYGEDYPANNLVLIYTENRQDNISDIYSLPVALEALSREFSYPSDHTDLTYADACSSLAQLFDKLIAI